MKLDKVIVGSLLVASTLLAGSGSDLTNWGYTGNEGPSNWGDLNPKYSMCKNGSNQSPINIADDYLVKTMGKERIEFNYESATTNIVNNGHTVQINVKNGSNIKLDGITFSLKQFNFHTPSENQIDGKSFPLEAQFVHESEKGELAIVALLFEDNGDVNKALRQIWWRMPEKAGETKSIKLSGEEYSKLFPRNKSYFRFSGSLTTPPCSEGVRWLVVKNYANISKSQVKDFLDVMQHKNSRPVQPINARRIMR